MITEGNLTLIIGNNETKGKWSLKGETLHWNIEGKEYKIESHGNLAKQILNFVKTLSKRVYNKKVTLKSCVACQYFCISTMARDMGRGQRGTCEFHNKGVEVCYLCENYKKKS